MNSDNNKEFLFSQYDTQVLKKLVRDKVGIELSDEKEYTISFRLQRKLKKYGLVNMNQYLTFINSSPVEEEQFINLVTNSSTDFFRGNEHFEYLKNIYLPNLMTRKHKIRIWSAACATGEEAYSIAIVVAESLVNHQGYDIKILATDVNSDSLRTARQAVYPKTKIEKLSRDRQVHNFITLKQNVDEVKVQDRLRKMITFNQLNLIETWPMHRLFDVIFICNTLMYFAKDAANLTLEKMDKMLEPGGLLIVGHTELLYEFLKNYHLVGSSMYKKPETLGRGLNHARKN